MQRKYASVSLIKFVSCAVLALVAVAQAQAADEKKADPAGTWIWTTPPRGGGGGADRTNTLVIKVDGDKVTGKLNTPGRGGQATDTDIKDAKMKGDELTFAIVREFNGNSITNKYMGKIAGDTIKGKTEFMNRDGEAQSRDWEAKRAEMKK